MIPQHRLLPLPIFDPTYNYLYHLGSIPEPDEVIASNLKDEIKSVESYLNKLYRLLDQFEPDLNKVGLITVFRGLG